MPNPQPQNFPTFGEYSTAIEKSYPGWDKLPHDYQEEYMGHAKADFDRYHQVRQNVKAVAAAEHRPGATPGEGKVAGPPEPRGMFRDPADVMGYKPRTEEEFGKQVLAPVNRATQAVLAGIVAGPFNEPLKAMKANWDNPGDHPYMQAATSMVPLLGAKTPDDARLDALLLAVDPAAKFMGLTLPAYEGARFGLGAAKRYLMRTGISAGAGVVSGLPSAIEQGSPMPLFSGGAKGAVAQQFSEAGSALFGIGRRAVSKGFQSDIIQSIAGPGAYFKEYLGDKLKSWNDFADYFLRTDTDKFHNAVSTLENQTADKIGRLESRAHHLLGGTEFEVTFSEEGQEMLRHKKLGKEMEGIALKPREAKPQQDVPAGPRRKNPLWKPGPAKKGETKAPYWTKGSAPKTIEAQTEIKPGTWRLTWDNAFKAMRNWEKRGWSAFGVPARGQEGLYARSLARFMRNELATQASAIDKGVGTNWLTAKTQEEAGHLWTNIFSHEGVLEGLKRNDASTFQKVVAGLPTKKGAPAGDSYMNDIIEILGSQDGKAFLAKVMHGGTAASPRDVVGAISPYVSAHATGFRVGVHPTMPYSGAGPVKTQIDVGREAWGLYMKLGGAAFMRMIHNAITDPAIDRPGDRRLVTG